MATWTIVKATPLSTEYFVGWSAELEQAWRLAGAAETSDNIQKEWATKIILDPNMDDDDNVIGEWGDGWRAQIAGLTARQWRARMAAEADKKRGAAIFSDNGLFIKKKKDRAGLLWIGKDDRPQQQLCQLRIDWLPTEADGIELMKKVLQAMARDADLNPYPYRDELLKTAGWGRKNKRANVEGVDPAQKEKRPKKIVEVAKKPAAAPLPEETEDIGDDGDDDEIDDSVKEGWHEDDDECTDDAPASEVKTPSPRTPPQRISSATLDNIVSMSMHIDLDAP